MRGKFITLEGIDGAGKSTHVAWLAGWLQDRDIAVSVTREPGGTELGEELRRILLDRVQRLHPETEALLMFAARREHLDKLILPALAAGTWVVCDRFTDASFAYQAGGSGVAWEQIETLEQWVQQGLQPDLTILFDLAPEIGRRRTGRIKQADRFEQEESQFYRRVREAYLRRAREHPERIHVVDASADIARIQKELEEKFISICNAVE
ncbi:MAG: dTMP kinase [Betaproteobacteria bacterium RIFCSPLOWO2_12_FULL_62_13]|nr:MAG: dTMP kinase [Betaproteobacteria bacterium RIFCSPLOWO2_12_FULL_62_13]